MPRTIRRQPTRSTNSKVATASVRPSGAKKKSTTSNPATPKPAKPTRMTKKPASSARSSDRTPHGAAARTRRAASTSPSAAPRDVAARVQSTLAALKAASSARWRASLVRFGIVAPRSFGVPMNSIQKLAKELGPDHELARALWRTEWYEARLVCAYVAEPSRLTPATMDQWCRDFDNWGVCDTLCLALFDRTPHAWGRFEAWAVDDREFVKRAAFALLAGLALHDRTTEDRPYLLGLKRIEAAADDERHYVKKGVNWALRAVGSRNRRLNEAAIALSRRLAASSDSTERWVGTDALRALTNPTTARRIAARERRADREAGN